MNKDNRKIKFIIDCEKTFEGDNIPVTRAFPVKGRREVDPFLLFDHFGPKKFDPGHATGIPAHPHCGFEAITYMLQGEIEHKDSWGGLASIKEGDIQWMTTGSGLVHSELSTSNFKKKGGVLEGLQIWVNLPKKNKKIKPGYQHIKSKDIPIISIKNNQGKIKIIAGNIFEKQSVINTLSPVSIFDIQFNEAENINFNIPKEQVVMIYIIDGELQFSGIKKTALKGQMIFFDNNSDLIDLTSISPKGFYLVLAGKPLNEPIARLGPFVANTEDEIKQAMLNYQNGKMGQLQ